MTGDTASGGEEGFLDRMADRLAGLPGVVAVALGGSRAAGNHRPDSDWDLAIYYRGTAGRFHPGDLREIGWSGQVSEIGGWGGGVFNGGAWLRVEDRPVDVHYRDLDDVDREIAAASTGRFRIEPLLFHLAGIPTYLVVGELAVNRTLRGELPRPEYPAALRERAPEVWWGRAGVTFGYAERNHARYGRVTQCVGLVAQAAVQAAHAVLAARGEWVTNEKTLVHRAGLVAVDRILAGIGTEPAELVAAVDAARAVCEASVRNVTAHPAG